MRSRFAIHQEQFEVQAQFMDPVFDLFKDLPSLLNHLSGSLKRYGIRLADFRLESGAGSFGDLNLQLSWASVGTVARVFLDKVEVSSDFVTFLHLGEGDLPADLLAAVEDYSEEVRFRAYTATHRIHGTLDSSPGEFLKRFSAQVPQALGPHLGSGQIFYFGAEEGRLASSLTLDLSQLVDNGIFLQLRAIHDGAFREELLATSQELLKGVLDEIGLEIVGGSYGQA